MARRTGLQNRTKEIKEQLFLIECILSDGNGNIWNALDKLEEYVEDLRKYISRLKRA